jgi:hypothetical protein
VREERNGGLELGRWASWMEPRLLQDIRACARDVRLAP